MFNDHDALFSQDPQSGCLTNLLGWVTGIILLLILCALSSCRAYRQWPTVVQLHDSTSTHVHTHTVFVPDTILVPLPPERVMVTIPDTASTLRTSVAESHAAIRGGLLHHELRNLPAPLPVPVQTKVITRDSIQYRTRQVPQPYPVPEYIEKPLTRWQRARLQFANAMLVALALAALVFALKKRAWWLRFFK